MDRITRLKGARAKSFEIYLRTGRLPTSRGTVEVKFNPWHDPEDGRFTFVGQGRYFGSGSQAGSHGGFGGGGASGSWQGPEGRDRFDPRNPRNYAVHVVKPGDTLTGIARLRKGVTIKDLAWLNAIPVDGTLRVGQKIKLPNQAYLDAGRDAKNRFAALDLYMQTHGGQLPPDAAHPPSIEAQINDPAQWHPVEKNGYRFDRDLAERTREVKGEVSIDATAKRSRRNQREAGGVDRRATDDGGHYIGARFNGPSDAFNHFAQDASFNRGAYRALEDEWTRDLREGHRVAIDIIPLYSGLSQRPYALAITWFVDGERQFKRFPNGKRDEQDGGR